jgi:hypothetical protein
MASFPRAQAPSWVLAVLFSALIAGCDAGGRGDGDDGEATYSVGGAIESDCNVGQLFGNLLLALVELSTGGPASPLESFWGAWGPQAAVACDYSGENMGTTLDSVAVSAAAPIPLGRHTLARNCILITYDFPDEIGAGTITIHFSGRGGGPGILNGSVDVNVTRDATRPASYEDHVVMALRDELSVGDDAGIYKCDIDGYRTLTMERWRVGRLVERARSTRRGSLSLRPRSERRRHGVGALPRLGDT